MVGQFSLFEKPTEKKRRPCEYSFRRYEGQHVIDQHGEHVIEAIEPYYTFYTDGTIGTPHDMYPLDPEEYSDYIDEEIEYEERKSQSNDDMCRTLAKGNLKILYALKEGIKEE